MGANEEVIKRDNCVETDENKNGVGRQINRERNEMRRIQRMVKQPINMIRMTEDKENVSTT